MIFSANISHPYYPKSLILPHFIPNDLSTGYILGVFTAFTTVILASTWIYTDTKKMFSKYNRFKLCWFVMSGCIHVEGYYSVFNKTLAGDQFFLSQLWKEYAMADSRYVTSDTFTVIMKTFTALIAILTCFVEGPSCFLIVAAFMTNKPYAHILQLLVSSGQLYGTILYFLTEYRDNFIHGLMWHPVYFWGYFIFMKSLWLVIPIMIVDSFKELKNAHRSYMKKSNSKNKKRR